MTKVEWHLPANTREQVLFAGVLLAFVFFYFQIVYLPQAERALVIKKNTASLQLEKTALSKLNVLSPGKIHPLSRRRDVKMKILSGDIVSAYQDVSLLLTRLTEPSFLGGIAIEDLSYLPQIMEKGYARTDFKVKLRGSFSEILHYLEKMENFPALFSLESINIQDVTGQPQEIESEILGHFFSIEKAGKGQAPPATADAGGKS